MRVLLTHPGTQYAPRLAAALHRQGVLYRYATGIAFPDTPEAGWWRLAALLGMEKLLRRRTVPGLPPGFIHLQPVKEAIALLRHQVLGQSNDTVFYARNRSFQRQVPERLIRAADAVIGFDTSSWLLADRCRRAGKPFILDASIAHPVVKEEVFAALRAQYPAWAKELAPKTPRLIEVELREIELATHIVAASEFTKKTYTDQGVPAGKITVNPYGTDLGSVKPVRQKVPTGQAPVFLFFGSLSARKGFPWLCSVWPAFRAKYPGCRLIAAGYDVRPPGFAAPEGVEVMGAVHPADRQALFAAADCFVFPSFFEGFGQVILEALACGLPVITTTATAGPDLLSAYPEAGITITPGDDDALLMALEQMTMQADNLSALSAAARAAAAPFTWDAYGKCWAEVVGKLI